MGNKITKTFATIELNSGYVWWVGSADSAEDACRKSDLTGGESADSYERISKSEINSTAGGYAVYEASGGFDVEDGQDADEIATVEALPLIGYYRAV